MPVDPKAELLARAERNIVEAVVEWADRKVWQERELTPFEDKLRILAYELERAKRVTGQVRVPVAKKDGE